MCVKRKVLLQNRHIEVISESCRVSHSVWKLVGREALIEAGLPHLQSSSHAMSQVTAALELPKKVFPKGRPGSVEAAGPPRSKTAEGSPCPHLSDSPSFTKRCLEVCQHRSPRFWNPPKPTEGPTTFQKSPAHYPSCRRR